MEGRRDDDAAALWRKVYGQLSEGRPGMLGAITSRAEAQVMRFALVYALLDRADAIGRVHLEAALALWAYAEASAAYVFGDALGDPDADALLAALRAQDNGLTRDQIRDPFGRHRRSAQLDRILSKLVSLGLAYSTHRPPYSHSGLVQRRAPLVRGDTSSTIDILLASGASRLLVA